MAVYLLIEVLHVKDEAAYRQYAKAVRPVMEGRGGEYVLRSSDIEAVTGPEKPERIILIHFHDEQDLRDCLVAPEYRALQPLRQQCAETRAFIVRP
jgi:uncharacterized protein (DUF1330 family)